MLKIDAAKIVLNHLIMKHLSFKHAKCLVPVKLEAYTSLILMTWVLGMVVFFILLNRLWENKEIKLLKITDYSFGFHNCFLKASMSIL